jgi:ankyrin repeat protein
MKMETVKKIHALAKEVNVDGLKALTPNEQKEINTQLKGLTPFHKVINSLNLGNFDQIFQVIKVFIGYKADINIKDSSGHTPFTLLLDKFAESRDEGGKKLLEHIIASFDDISAGGEEKIIMRTLDILENPNFCEVKKKVLDRGLLRSAVKHGSTVGVERLLKMGARADIKGRGEIQTLLGMACQKGFYKIVKQLAAEKGISDSTDPLLSIVVRNWGETRLDSSSDYKKCFEFLINHKVDINAKDNWNNTALHYAVRYKNEEAIKTLLENKAHIGTSNLFYAVPISNMYPDILEQFFDSCITDNKKQPGDKEYEIKFDYSCLVPPASETKELTPMLHMTKTKELRHLIEHPLVTSFLFLKWRKLYSLFYWNLVFCSIFSFALIAFIAFPTTDGTVWMLIPIVFGFIYLLVRAILQLWVSSWDLLVIKDNWMDFLLIILTGCILVESDQKKFVTHKFGPITIILVAVELLVMVGYLPFFKISTYMVMLKTVSKSFLDGLLLYSIILTAFAFSFFTMFRTIATADFTQQNTPETGAKTDDELNWFTSPGIALVKILVMMTGEFDAGSIKFHQHPSSYLMFLLFLFLISIVLWNLLTGLAVSDIQVRTSFFFIVMKIFYF